jgi:hypothetical protein
MKNFLVISFLLLAACVPDDKGLFDNVTEVSGNAGASSNKIDMDDQIEALATTPIPCEQCHAEAKEQRNNFVHLNFELEKVTDLCR